MSRYIDAEAMKEWIDEYVSVFKKSDNKDIKGYIEHQPTIEAVPKDFHDKTCEAMAKVHQAEILELTADRPQGTWFKDDEGTFICSACGSGYKDQPTLMGKPLFKWCPICGAKMKGADNGNFR